MFSPIQINFGSSSPLISQVDIAVTPTSFDAVDLAYRLSRLSTFLTAAHELLSVLAESHNIIRTRKMIRLLELARKTLERAGIVLYSFASCPEAFIAHKKVYIDLLEMLQANEGQENTELRGRIRILLMPLTSHFSIQQRGSSLKTFSTLLQIHLSRTTSVSSSSGEGTRSLDLSSSAAQSTRTMLPPDAFPAVIRPQPSPPIRDFPIERCRSPLWDSRQLNKSPTSKRRLDQENIGTQYRPPKKLRQFGIYCTRKSSMNNWNSFRRNERQTFVLSLCHY